MATKLHELLAVEKTVNASWLTLLKDTTDKFIKEVAFVGYSKSLKMLEDTPANVMIEAQNRDEKSVPTTVKDTLDYALDFFVKAEKIQMEKNSANRVATATVMMDGKPFLVDLPVDSLLGLESRLAEYRKTLAHIPTLDASRHWIPAPTMGANVWEGKFPEEATKTEKVMTPVVLSPATDKHPAQVEKVTKDMVVGKTTTIRRSGAATAVQKAQALTDIDRLLIEIKQARMRANETVVVSQDNNAQVLKDYFMAPFA